MNSRVARHLIAMLIAIAAVPLAAQVNDTYVIAGVGKLPGLYNTQWMSQLSLFNPHMEYPLRVSVTLLPNGGGKPQEVIVTVPANSTVVADDAIGEIFSIQHDAMGALLLATFPEDNPSVPNTMIARAFLVNSNTFNNSSAGTYGQTIPGVWAGLQDDGITAMAHGLRNISRYGWRTNFGGVNLGSTPVVLRLNIYDANGAPVRENLAYTLPAQGVAQWQLPVELDRGSVEFTLQDATKQAVVFPFTSQIDQYSGDPSYQGPILLASARSLYGKSPAAVSAAAMYPGHRLTTDDARAIRAQADRLGDVQIQAK